MKHSSLITPALPKATALSSAEINQISENHSSLIIAAAAVLLLATSCHKTCTCIGFNGKEHTYTAEEVSAFGGTCTDMKYMYTSASSGADVRFYTVCNWD